MPSGSFLAGYLLLPLAFGLIPSFLPPKVPLTMRWGLWLTVLVLGIGYALLMKRESEPYVWLALGCFAASSTLSLMLLVVGSHRDSRTKSSGGGRLPERWSPAPPQARRPAAGRRI